MKTLYGRAPLRIGLAGGGTDIKDVYDKYGGIVVNTTIDKYVYGKIEERKDRKIYINDVLLSKSNDFTKQIIKKVKPTKGFNFWFHNDIPYGRGLGSSSSYAVLLTKLIYNLENKHDSDSFLINTIYGIENEFGVCGWQDQIAAVYGGFRFITLSETGFSIQNIYVDDDTKGYLEGHLILVYTGKQHNSGNIQKKNIKLMTKEQIDNLKNLALKMRVELETKPMLNFIELLREGWETKKNKVITNKKIDNLYTKGLKAGAIAGKLLGGGNGGYFLFYVPLEKMENFKKEFDNYELETFHFVDKGVEVWQ